MPLPTAPPMIRPSASVASERAGARHPDPQHDHGNRLDRHQGDLGELIIGLEPAKADPDIPGQHQVEERRDPDRAALGEVEHVEQPELRGLVDHQRRDRGNDAGAEVRGSRAFEARHLSGLLFLLFALVAGGFLPGFLVVFFLLAFLAAVFAAAFLAPFVAEEAFLDLAAFLALAFLAMAFLALRLS